LRNPRNLLSLALCATAAAASAQISLSSISANYTLNPGATTLAWFNFVDSAGLSVDFTQNAPAFRVGASTTFSTGSSTITYNVTSVSAIGSVDLVLQGDVENFGRIQFSESATASSNSIGSISGSILGASYSGGANGAFTNIYHLNFSQAVTSFSMSETMSEDINGQSLPSASLAVVGTVEQDFAAAVPEPASMVGLALGAIALIRRRRK